MKSDGSSSIPDTTKSKKQFDLGENLQICESTVNEDTPKAKGEQI